MASTFAVFGDIHGRISLMLVLARRWEVDSGHTLTGVLQVGDMGAFPDPTRLDAATARHARHDPDELGYSQYRAGCDEGAALLSGSTWPVVWVRGNHEDEDHLRTFASPTAIDPWQRLWFVPDGTTFTVNGVRIGAMGGKPASRRPSRPPCPHSISTSLAQNAYPQKDIDVLLSHAGPREILRHGSRQISALCARIRPRVHLFGHHHIRHGPTASAHGVQHIGLDHLGFVRGRLQRGCWGILHLGDDGSIRWTWGDTLHWTPKIKPHTYRDEIPHLAASPRPFSPEAPTTTPRAVD